MGAFLLEQNRGLSNLTQQLGVPHGSRDAESFCDEEMAADVGVPPQEEAALTPPDLSTWRSNEDFL